MRIPVHPSNKTAARYRSFIVALVLTGLLWPTLLFAAPPSRKAQLQKKRATIQSRISSVKRKLNQALRVERQKRGVLKQAEGKLIVARHALRVSVLELARKQVELHRAQRALVEARQQFSYARKDVSKRLVNLYERGETGYLDMLLSSDSVGDLLQRSEFADVMVEQDQEALSDLRDKKEKVADYQDQVDRKTQEAARVKQRAAVRHNLTDIERREAQGDFADARGERQRIENELRELERESNAIAAMIRAMRNTPKGRRLYNARYSGGMGGLPVRGRVGSGFGMRFHPILHRYRMHTGVDIAAPTGTPIVATGGGEVIFAGRRGGYGNAVIIDHGRGKATLYAHMSSFAVSSGQVVSRGQMIGRVGSTGLSTGPHCHYEVRINGTPVNPL